MGYLNCQIINSVLYAITCITGYKIVKKMKETRNKKRTRMHKAQRNVVKVMILQVRISYSNKTYFNISIQIQYFCRRCIHWSLQPFQSWSCVFFLFLESTCTHSLTYPQFFCSCYLEWTELPYSSVSLLIVESCSNNPQRHRTLSPPFLGKRSRTMKAIKALIKGA